MEFGTLPRAEGVSKKTVKIHSNFTKELNIYSIYYVYTYMYVLYIYDKINIS